MVTSSVGASNLNSYYGGLSSGGAGSNTQSSSGLPTQDSVTLQSDTSLLQSLSQSGATVGSMAGYPTNIQQTVQDEQMIASNTNLAQTLSQVDTPQLALPTNIQQAVQDQVTLATNTNLAQTVSQQAASPLFEPQEVALKTLPADNDSTQSDQSLTSLATSMQVLQNLASTGTLASNPTLAQSLLQNYSLLTSPSSLGSLVNTSA